MCVAYTALIVRVNQALSVRVNQLQVILLRIRSALAYVCACDWVRGEDCTALSVRVNQLQVILLTSHSLGACHPR
jgi:hypothetical protein